MKLVIISGTTSTGKTTLANRLAKDLHIDTFLRDDYKERRFDALPKAPTFKQLKEIDDASHLALSEAIKNAVKSDTSLIVETNFTKTQAKKIRHLVTADTTVVEVFCYANGFRVFKRYASRYNSGERHKGHRDYLWYPIVGLEAFGLGRLRYQPVKLSPHVLRVNTNNFANVDYEAILQFVKRAA